MFTKQNTEQKVYKHVMFIKQKVYIQVMFTKQSFTNTLCLQNKINSLQASYVYKTKVYKHVMFTKQKFTDKLYLQNITIQNGKFTITLYL